jgi:predicted aldo/keto reductase-like oxidoreductase
MAFRPPPDPKSPLNIYRILSPNAAVRVSPLCFGAMNLGTAWKEMMGEVGKEESFKLLDYFYDQGGNFIDVFTPQFTDWLTMEDGKRVPE